MNGRFSISWQTYQNNFCNGFSNLQQQGEFVDMTLAADGHHVQVHKTVMSLISPYIKDLIITTKCAHPVIFLNNVSHETLKSILEYAYTGETLVPQHRLQEFMQASRSLNINGLDILPSLRFAEANDTNTLKTVNIDQDNVEELDDICENEDESSENESNSQIIFENDNCTVENISMSHIDIDADEPKVDETDRSEDKTPLQYTVSNQGNLQIILNRFMYFHRYQRKTNNEIVWRCIDYYSNIKCSAIVITKNGKVVKRARPHNHPFHDKRILKCSKRNKVYSMLSEAKRTANLINNK